MLQRYTRRLCMQHDTLVGERIRQCSECDKPSRAPPAHFLATTAQRANAQIQTQAMTRPRASISPTCGERMLLSNGKGGSGVGDGGDGASSNGSDGASSDGADDSRNG